jgi:hypothetical protein
MIHLKTNTDNRGDGTKNQEFFSRIPVAFRSHNLISKRSKSCLSSLTSHLYNILLYLTLEWTFPSSFTPTWTWARNEAPLQKERLSVPRDVPVANGAQHQQERVQRASNQLPLIQEPQLYAHSIKILMTQARFGAAAKTTNESKQRTLKLSWMAVSARTNPPLVD